MEKHYGPVSMGGAKKLGRLFSEAMFAFFRQAPLSYRERAEAAIATHLANRFIVAFSQQRLGYVLTPPILYTRYDPQSGGYVHAFPYVGGRPLRPFQDGLPLLGEAAAVFSTMRRWRDFLAKELGFWGLARQVDPGNPNAFSNLWITPDHHILLLDVVPGIPGLEPRYFWWGLSRGQFPPFGDAIDFAKLARRLKAHPLDPADSWAHDFALLRAAVEKWQASEPRVWSSFLRGWRLLTDRELKRATRAALLTHLEVKGAITTDQAKEYGAALAQTDRFPKLLRHTLLKMAPLPLHRFFTDGAYALKALLDSWRWPIKILRAILHKIGIALKFVGRTFLLIWQLLISPPARLEHTETVVGRWIAEEQHLGRLTEEQASRMRQTMQSDPEIANLSGLFVIHLALRALKPSGFGPTSLFLFGTALATGDWRLAIPAMIDPALRVLTTVCVGLWRRPWLVMFTALPSIGLLATPLQLLRQQPELGGFMIRSLGREAALHIPGFGERGSLTEMLGVAAAQATAVDSARLLPYLLVAGLVGARMHWHWLEWVSLACYAAFVLGSMATRRRTPAPHGIPAAQWQFGYPDGLAAPSNEPRLSPDAEATITEALARDPASMESLLSGFSEPTKRRLIDQACQRLQGQLICSTHFRIQLRNYVWILKILRLKGILQGLIVYPFIGIDPFPALVGPVLGINSKDSREVLYDDMNENDTEYASAEIDAAHLKENLTFISQTNALDLDRVEELVRAKRGAQQPVTLFLKGLHWAQYYRDNPAWLKNPEEASTRYLIPLTRKILKAGDRVVLFDDDLVFKEILLNTREFEVVHVSLEDHPATTPSVLASRQPYSQRLETTSPDAFSPGARFAVLKKIAPPQDNMTEFQAPLGIAPFTPWGREYAYALDQGLWHTARRIAAWEGPWREIYYYFLNPIMELFRFSSAPTLRATPLCPSQATALAQDIVERLIARMLADHEFVFSEEGRPERASPSQLETLRGEIRWWVAPLKLALEGLLGRDGTSPDSWTEDAIRIHLEGSLSTAFQRHRLHGQRIYQIHRRRMLENFLASADLEDLSRDVWTEAREALIRAGDDVLPLLEMTLRDLSGKRIRRRRLAVEALERIGGDPAARPLCESLRSESDRAVFLRIIEALGAMALEDATPVVTALSLAFQKAAPADAAFLSRFGLEGKPEKAEAFANRARSQIILSLNQIGPGQAWEALRALEKADRRLFAELTPVNAGTVYALLNRCDAMKDRPHGPRFPAWWREIRDGLTDMGEPVLRYLSKAEGPFRRLMAVQVYRNLAGGGSARAVDLLIQATEEEVNTYVLKGAVQALGDVRSAGIDRAVDALTRIIRETTADLASFRRRLRREDPVVVASCARDLRRVAAAGLRNLSKRAGSQKAGEVVAELHVSNPELFEDMPYLTPRVVEELLDTPSAAAQDILVKFGRYLIPLLESHLAYPDVLPEHANRRAAAVEVLARIGGEEAIALLNRIAAHEPNDHARSAALRALLDDPKGWDTWEENPPRPLENLTWKEEDRRDVEIHFRGLTAMLERHRLTRCPDAPTLQQLAQGVSPKEYYDRVVTTANLPGGEGDWDIEFIETFAEQEPNGSQWFIYPEQLDNILGFVSGLLKEDPERTITILNYGTAHGEEALSIAVYLDSVFKDRYPKATFKVIGKDILAPNTSRMNWVNLRRVPGEVSVKLRNCFIPISEKVAVPRSSTLALVELGEGDVRKVRGENPDLRGQVDIFVANGLFGPHVSSHDNLARVLLDVKALLRDKGRLFVSNRHVGKADAAADFTDTMSSLIAQGHFRRPLWSEPDMYENVATSQENRAEHPFLQGMAPATRYAAVYEWAMKAPAVFRPVAWIMALVVAVLCETWSLLLRPALQLWIAALLGLAPATEAIASNDGSTAALSSGSETRLDRYETMGLLTEDRLFSRFMNAHPAVYHGREASARPPDVFSEAYKNLQLAARQFAKPFAQAIQGVAAARDPLGLLLLPLQLFDAALASAFLHARHNWRVLTRNEGALAMATKAGDDPSGIWPVPLSRRNPIAVKYQSTLVASRRFRSEAQNLSARLTEPGIRLRAPSSGGTTRDFWIFRTAHHDWLFEIWSEYDLVTVAACEHNPKADWFSDTGFLILPSSVMNSIRREWPRLYGAYQRARRRSLTGKGRNKPKHSLYLPLPWFAGHPLEARRILESPLIQRVLPALRRISDASWASPFIKLTAGKKSGTNPMAGEVTLIQTPVFNMASPKDHVPLHVACLIAGELLHAVLPRSVPDDRAAATLKLLERYFFEGGGVPIRKKLTRKGLISMEDGRQEALTNAMALLWSHLVFWTAESGPRQNYSLTVQDLGGSAKALADLLVATSLLPEDLHSSRLGVPDESPPQDYVKRLRERLRSPSRKGQALDGPPEDAPFRWSVPMDSLIGSSLSIHALSFAGDGKDLLFVDGKGNLRRVNLTSGKVSKGVRVHARAAYRSAIRPDGKAIAWHDGFGVIRYRGLTPSWPYDIVLKDPAYGATTTLAFHPGGKILAVGLGDYGTVRLWDIGAKEIIRTIEGIPGFIYGLAFSPDGKTLACAGSEAVHLVDADTGELLATLKHKGEEFHSVAFHPHGGLLAVGGNSGAIYLWDLASGEPVITLHGHGTGVRHLSFTPDGDTLASTAVDETALLWNAAQIQALGKARKIPGASSLKKAEQILSREIQRMRADKRKKLPLRMRVGSARTLAEGGVFVPAELATPFARLPTPGSQQAALLATYLYRSGTMTIQRLRQEIKELGAWEKQALRDRPPDHRIAIEVHSWIPKKHPRSRAIQQLFELAMRAPANVHETGALKVRTEFQDGGLEFQTLPSIHWKTQLRILQLWDQIAQAEHFDPYGLNKGDFRDSWWHFSFNGALEYFEVDALLPLCVRVNARLGQKLGRFLPVNDSRRYTIWMVRPPDMGGKFGTRTEITVKVWVGSGAGSAGARWAYLEELLQSLDDAVAAYEQRHARPEKWRPFAEEARTMPRDRVGVLKYLRRLNGQLSQPSTPSDRPSPIPMQPTVAMAPGTRAAMLSKEILAQLKEAKRLDNREGVSRLRDKLYWIVTMFAPEEEMHFFTDLLVAVRNALLETLQTRDPKEAGLGDAVLDAVREVIDGTKRLFVDAHSEALVGEKFVDARQHPSARDDLSQAFAAMIMALRDALERCTPLLPVSSVMRYASAAILNAHRAYNEHALREGLAVAMARTLRIPRAGSRHPKPDIKDVSPRDAQTKPPTKSGDRSRLEARIKFVRELQSHPGSKATQNDLLEWAEIDPAYLPNDWRDLVRKENRRRKKEKLGLSQITVSEPGKPPARRKRRRTDVIKFVSPKPTPLPDAPLGEPLDEEPDPAAPTAPMPAASPALLTVKAALTQLQAPDATAQAQVEAAKNSLSAQV